jgi:hypothetical protein
MSTTQTVVVSVAVAVAANAVCGRIDRHYFGVFSLRLPHPVLVAIIERTPQNAGPR